MSFDHPPHKYASLLYDMFSEHSPGTPDLDFYRLLSSPVVSLEAIKAKFSSDKNKDACLTSGEVRLIFHMSHTYCGMINVNLKAFMTCVFVDILSDFIVCSIYKGMDFSQVIMSEKLSTECENLHAWVMRIKSSDRGGDPSEITLKALSVLIGGVFDYSLFSSRELNTIVSKERFAMIWPLLEEYPFFN